MNKALPHRDRVHGIAALSITLAGLFLIGSVLFDLSTKLRHTSRAFLSQQERLTEIRERYVQAGTTYQSQIVIDPVLSSGFPLPATMEALHDTRSNSTDIIKSQLDNIGSVSVVNLQPEIIGKIGDIGETQNLMKVGSQLRVTGTRSAVLKVVPSLFSLHHQAVLTDMTLRASGTNSQLTLELTLNAFGIITEAPKKEAGDAQE